MDAVSVEYIAVEMKVSAPVRRREAGAAEIKQQVTFGVTFATDTVVWY